MRFFSFRWTGIWGSGHIRSTQIYSRLNIDPIKLSVDRAIDKMLEVGGGQV